MEFLVKDWKASVVQEITSGDNLDKLAEYALHLSRILAYPGLDVGTCVAKIATMGQVIVENIKKSSGMHRRPTQIIEKINDYFYNVQKFKPNTNDYYNPLNSYLNVVLERKTGIPITLCILYLSIARTVGLKMQPVSFPGHFLVKHVLEDNSGEIIVDPFNSGRIMDLSLIHI